MVTDKAKIDHAAGLLKAGKRISAELAMAVATSKRYPELVSWCEDIIAKDPLCGLTYINVTAKGRWPKLEATILSAPYDRRLLDTCYIYAYAQEVVKGRWPEGEAVLLNLASRLRGSHDQNTVTEWLFLYARDIIGDVWPEAEPYICKSFYLQHYLRAFPEFEKVMVAFDIVKPLDSMMR